MDKKFHKTKKDQEKHNHREAYKGHKTKKHFISSIKDEEAEKDIRDTRIPPCRNYEEQ
jgi:hypothetical protein